jgi:hypothetical protein
VSPPKGGLFDFLAPCTRFLALDFKAFQRKYRLINHLRNIRVRNLLITNIHQQQHTRGRGSPTPMSTPLCKHQFTDRTTCQSVALRGQHYCMWHRTEADRRRRSARVTRLSRRRPISLTISQNPSIAQHNIQQVIDAILADRISDKRAGILLYAIANNLYS